MTFDALSEHLEVCRASDYPAGESIRNDNTPVRMSDTLRPERLSSGERSGPH